MESLLEFARGPGFAVSFLVMTLGLARHVVLQLYELISSKGERIKGAKWRKIVSDSLSWLFPIRHLVHGTILMSLMSFVFHVGVILVPLFLADHIILWERFFGVDLPELSPTLADLFTLLTIGAILGLFGYRVLTLRTRVMSRASDYLILGMVLLPFITGYLAAHPRINPFSWQSVMLVHLLSAEVLMIIVPFTKLAHIVLFPFNRLSEVHWQLKPGAGAKVAAALYGKGAQV